MYRMTLVVPDGATQSSLDADTRGIRVVSVIPKAAVGSTWNIQVANFGSNNFATAVSGIASASCWTTASGFGIFADTLRITTAAAVSGDKEFVIYGAPLR